MHKYRWFMLIVLLAALFVCLSVPVFAQEGDMMPVSGTFNYLDFVQT